MILSFIGIDDYFVFCGLIFRSLTFFWVHSFSLLNEAGRILRSRRNPRTLRECYKNQKVNKSCLFLQFLLLAGYNPNYLTKLIDFFLFQQIQESRVYDNPHTPYTMEVS